MPGGFIMKNTKEWFTGNRSNLFKTLIDRHFEQKTECTISIIIEAPKEETVRAAGGTKVRALSEMKQATQITEQTYIHSKPVGDTGSIIGIYMKPIGEAITIERIIMPEAFSKSKLPSTAFEVISKNKNIIFDIPYFFSSIILKFSGNLPFSFMCL